MPNQDTIQDIIERIEAARDRCQNASDPEGVQDSNQALADLRSLGPDAMPTARDVEDYFLERVSARSRGAKVPQNSPIRTTASRLVDDDSDDS